MVINQREHERKILLDNSQMNLITRKLINRLQVRKRALNFMLSGLGETSTKAQYYLELRTKSQKITADIYLLAHDNG